MSRSIRVVGDRRRSAQADAAQDGAVGVRVGDKVGGGSPAISTQILHAAPRDGVRHREPCDPKVGSMPAGGVVGAFGNRRRQGNIFMGAPFPIDATVTALRDGRYEETADHVDSIFTMDQCCIAHIRRLRLVLTSRGGASAT